MATHSSLLAWKNPMDREAWQATVHGVAKSWTWLSIWAYYNNYNCPLLLPSIFPNIRVFSSQLALYIRWPKYWSFSFRFRPFREYSGLFSFRIDWFDLLIVQWTLRSLLQHHSLKNESFSAQPFLWFNSHICTWLCKKHSFDYMDPCWQSNISAF